MLSLVIVILDHSHHLLTKIDKITLSPDHERSSTAITPNLAPYQNCPRLHVILLAHRPTKMTKIVVILPGMTVLDSRFPALCYNYHDDDYYDDCYHCYYYFLLLLLLLLLRKITSRTNCY